MILISHRGNISGPNPAQENSPHYITEALRMGYHVEVDMWRVDNRIYLGHDEPQYEIADHWLQDKASMLWIHCKNFEVLSWIKDTELHYFWHESDTLTLTSKNYIWAYPGKQPIVGSIAVMPELYDDDVSKCLGVCSDYIKKF